MSFIIRDTIPLLSARGGAVRSGACARLAGCERNLGHSRDFRSRQPFNRATYFDEAVDIHYIFPRAWRQKADIFSKQFDTIVNKTPLRSKTNLIVGGDAPSQYLDKLPHRGGASDAEVDRHLQSHLIDPALLRADDFDAFIANRREALLALIEKAIGKSVYRGTATDEPVEDVLESEAIALEAAE